jgi:hypothetical protein
MSVQRTGSISVCLVALICLFVAAPAARAQVAAGEITGIIQDQGGGAVPGATVAVTNIATNQQRVVTSTGDGVYTAASLPPGSYRIDIELAGFKPIRREGIRLSTGEKGRIDFNLRLATCESRSRSSATRRSCGAETASSDRGSSMNRSAAAERPTVRHARYDRPWRYRRIPSCPASTGGGLDE